MITRSTCRILRENTEIVFLYFPLSDAPARERFAIFALTPPFAKSTSVRAFRLKRQYILKSGKLINREIA